MKNIFKKNSRIVAAGIVGLSLFGGTYAFASENNDIGYSFTIKANYANSYSTSRYRSATNNLDQWKVNLQESYEGDGTFTTFWIDGYSGSVFDSWKMASAPHDVQQGTGSHYYTTNNEADESNIRLVAENNNSSPNSYNVYGVWDEETGVIQR
jgi:Protein of unknown function (DUF2712)